MKRKAGLSRLMRKVSWNTESAKYEGNFATN